MSFYASRSTEVSAGPAFTPGVRQHWVPRKKAEILIAIREGALSLDKACRQYLLSPEELLSWQASFASDGVGGLKVTKLVERRRTNRQKVREPAAALLESGDRLQCIITDVGGQGAKLDFGVRLPVPNEFTLMHSSSGRSLPVFLRWNRERYAGVQFNVPLESELAGIVDLGSWLLGTVNEH